VAGKISVIGDVGVNATLGAGARGADVVVAAAGSDVVAAARLAPAAVLLVVGADSGEVGRVLDATLWPRQRVAGVRAEDAERAARAVAEGSVVTVRATLRDGEHEVIVGPGGIVLAR
jgi:hypothetical protein